MRVTETHKQKVINFIDKINDRFKRTSYEKDLNDMRNKYIYMEIGVNEFKKDVYCLNCIKKINN